MPLLGGAGVVGVTRVYYLIAPASAATTNYIYREYTFLVANKFFNVDEPLIYCPLGTCNFMP